MSASCDTILLPVETQTREFDGKLLLACCLAERDVPVILGSRIEMHLKINRLPVGLYHAKDVRKPSQRIFRIMRQLGHTITVLDEEAVVYYSPRSYHEHRVASSVMGAVDAFFAWGPDNAKLIETAPGYRGQPIRVMGNPRMDLLRPELRAFFSDEVAAYRERFGDFVLINSNFGSVNHYFSNLSRTGDASLLNGRAPSDSFMAGAFAFRHQMLKSFLDMLPQLADALPDTPIVVRPHPAENHDTWRAAAAGRSNVHVIHEGNVYGWLLASSVKIHNGCTTAIESFLLGQPSIAFAPCQSPRYELKLPNQLSRAVETTADLIDLTRGVLAGSAELTSSPDQRDVAAQYFAGLDGPLAAERTAQDLERILAARAGNASAPVGRRLLGHGEALVRAAEKRINERRPRHKNSRAYSRHRFPGITSDAVNARIAALGGLLGRFDGLTAVPCGENLFRIVRH